MLELRWRGASAIGKVLPTLAGQTFKHVDFSGIDLSRRDLSGSTFIACGFHESDLMNVRIDRRTAFVDCDLSTALGGHALLEKIENLKAPQEEPDWARAKKLPPTLWEEEQAEAAKQKANE